MRGADAAAAIAHGADLSLAADTPPTVTAALAARIAKCPDGLVRALRTGGDHHFESYRGLWLRAAVIAAGLRACGARDGCQVVLLIDDAVDFVAAFWACLRGGFIAVPLNGAAHDALRAQGRAALGATLEKLNHPFILADPHFEPLARSIGNEIEITVLPFALLQARGHEGAEDAPPAEPVSLLPTSGSTGRLRLVALGQHAIMHREFAAHQPPFKSEHHFLGTFPIDGIGGYLMLFPRLQSWTQMPASILAANPVSVLDSIEQFAITALPLTNSMVKQIVTAAEKTDRRWNLGSLRHIGLGAETVVPELMQQFERFLVRHGAPPGILRAGYGTTETGLLTEGADPTAAMNADDGATALGSGAPGVALRIVGDQGDAVAEGEIGDVQARCPEKIFTCYWGEPEASQECFTADGWWRTGDRGRLRNGALTLHGRSKEVLVVHGRKFSLSDIDAELQRVLAVGDQAFSCAILWPAESTERLAIVLVPGVSDDDRRAELAGEIRRAIERRFGIAPSPILTASLDQIPVTAGGKLRRFELAALVQSGMLDIVERSSRLPPTTRRPDASTEQRLKEIWREVLDIAGEIDRNASFFDLGGDSLRSVILQTAIERQFAVQVPAEEFFVAPTFDTLLRLVVRSDAGSRQPCDTSGVPWPLPPRLRNRLLASFETWDGERPTRDRLIARLNSDGSKTPLFWVFQLDFEFRQLAKALGADQPLYGFRSGYGFVDYREDEIQMLALRYVSEIIEVHPHGPLFVGGNCQGSIIALAMAQNLLRRRRHVPLVMLMEAGGMPIQTYPGPVLLLHGNESVYGNPHKLFRHPELAWRRAFSDYGAVGVPGEYGLMFDNDAIDGVATTLAQYMQTAETLPAKFIPALAQHAGLTAIDIPVAMACGERRTIAVEVRNASTVIWPAGETSGLMLGNRWLDETGTLAVAIDARVPLPELAPGAQAHVRLPITGPSHPGDMQLIVDVVEEGHTWFNPVDHAALRAPVKIHAAADNQTVPTGRPWWRRLGRTH